MLRESAVILNESYDTHIWYRFDMENTYYVVVWSVLRHIVKEIISFITWQLYDLASFKGPRNYWPVLRQPNTISTSIFFSLLGKVRREGKKKL